MYVLITTNFMDLSMSECVYSFLLSCNPLGLRCQGPSTKGLPLLGFLFSVYTVSVLQGSYCSRDMLCSMLTHQISNSALYSVNV